MILFASVCQLFLLISSQTGLDLFGANYIVSFISLTFVPGILLLGAFGFDFNRFEVIPYAMVASFSLVMVTFSAYILIYNSWNGLYLFEPLSETGIVFALLLLTVFEIGMFRHTDNQPEFPTRSDVATLVNKKSVYGLILPAVAISGAVLVNKYAGNTVILLAIFMIAVVPLIYIYSNGVTESEPLLLLWLAAVAILLQNTIINIHLMRGDGIVEYYYSSLSLHHNTWNLGLSTTKNSLGRLTLLHPIYSELMDLSLLWEYKIVHPLLLSMIPVVLHRIYSIIFDKKYIAFFAAFLYIAYHPFFSLISRNTRTGFAIMFISAFVLALIDGSLEKRNRIVLLSLIIFGTVNSHYGMSLLFLFIIGVAYIILNIIDTMYDRMPAKPHGLSLFLPLLFAVFFYFWYNYTSSSHTFTFISIILIKNIFLNLSQFFGTESAAVSATATIVPSFTYSYIKYSYIFIIVASGFGSILIGFSHPAFKSILNLFLGSTISEKWQSLWGEMNTVYLTMTGGAGLLAIAALAPVSALGVGRIVLLVILFLNPFFIFVLSLPGNNKMEQMMKITIAVFIIFTLLTTSGFVAATVTDERSPQPNIDRERILTSGTEWERYHMFRQYRTSRDFSTSGWIYEYNDGSTIYHSSAHQGPITQFFHTGYTTERPPGINSAYFSRNTSISEGEYAYFSTYNVRERMVIPNSPHDTFSQISTYPFDNYNLHSENKVYANGGGIIIRG